MKLVVGLGNPGKSYFKNRHNVGFMVVDEIKKRLGIADEFRENSKFEAEVVKHEDWVLAKPLTFMNRSGVAVGGLFNFYKLAAEDLVVIHDDLDIKFGSHKIQFGVGPKVHNGLLSIEEFLGNKNFWRVRVGIDGRGEQKSAWSGRDYVLDDFSDIEFDQLSKLVNEIAETIVTTKFER